MSKDDLDKQKKFIAPYITTAEDLLKMTPPQLKVSYYMKLYALEQVSIKYNSPNKSQLQLLITCRSPQHSSASRYPISSLSFTSSQLKQGVKFGRQLHPKLKEIIKITTCHLEKEQASLNLNSQTDPEHCLNFGLLLFGRADKADRDSQSDPSLTAKKFTAAAKIIKSCEQFGPLPESYLQYYNYAMSRGVTIMRALAEGRAPAPPTPREAKPLSEEEDKLLQEFQASQQAVVDHGGGTEERHIASLLTTAAVPARSTGGTTTCTTGPMTNNIIPGLPPTIANFDAEEGEEESPSAPPLPSPPPQQQLQYKFSQFMKVLYRPLDKNKQQPPLKGTIGQVLQSPSIGTTGRYTVALADKVVEASSDCLSPDIAAGDVVWYASSSNSYNSEEAVVHRVDVSYWPPSYVVQLKGSGAFRDCSMYQLQLKGPESNNGGGGERKTVAPATGRGATAHPVPASPPPPPPPPQAAAVVGYKPAMKAVVEAHKMTKQAASALSFEDVPTAVKLLNEALRLLTRPS